MEAFSDGVFSIAATLLVLEIAIHPPGTALEQLWREWPAYLGYLISFLTIGAAWLVHSAMTDRITRADAILLRINLLLLLVIAFLPFPTKLIAEAIHDTHEERVFVTVYGLTLLTIRLLGFAVDAYARREGLYSKDDAAEAGDADGETGNRSPLHHSGPDLLRGRDDRAGYQRWPWSSQGSSVPVRGSHLGSTPRAAPGSSRCDDHLWRRRWNCDRVVRAHGGRPVGSRRATGLIRWRCSRRRTRRAFPISCRYGTGA
jgi:uncharacterized membrane protein